MPLSTTSMYQIIGTSCLFLFLLVACQQKKPPPKISLVADSTRLLIGYYNQATIRQRKRASSNDLYQEVDTSRFEQLSVLAPSDALLLEQIIRDSTIEENYHQAHCYDPRHCILWENKQQEVIAYLEICFRCHNARGSFSTNIYSNKQMYQLRVFFRERKRAE